VLEQITVETLTGYRTVVHAAAAVQNADGELRRARGCLWRKHWEFELRWRRHCLEFVGSVRHSIDRWGSGWRFIARCCGMNAVDASGPARIPACRTFVKLDAPKLSQSQRGLSGSFLQAQPTSRFSRCIAAPAAVGGAHGQLGR
jgi:hypothetical protein